MFHYELVCVSTIQTRLLAYAHYYCTKPLFTRILRDPYIDIKL